jgi:ATP-dependent exoDNAse (exonuclease V) alpha subunit
MLAKLMEADMRRVTEWKIPSKRILSLPRYWYCTEDPEEEPSTSFGPIPYQTYADLANLIRELLDISPTSEWKRRLDRANACLEVIQDTKCYWIRCNQIVDSQAETLSDEYPDNDPFRRRMHHDTEFCSLAKFDSIESELSTYFAQLCRSSSYKQPTTDPSEKDELLLDSISQSMRIRLSDEQKDAMRTALRSKISVITGGAGSGKSTVLYALYQAISQDSSCSEVVKACAPTGKASMRLAEIGIDDPSTVHRALYAQGSKSIEVFILDEQSMQCPEVLARLLAKHQPQKLVFVGDPAQLSSLSPGRLLLDLIEVVPTMHLSVCLRSDDLIKTNACRVRDGASVEELATAPGKFEIVPDFCMARLVERYLCMWSRGQDVCVLAPTNKEVVQINTLVHTRLESIRNQRNLPQSELERRVLDRLQKEEQEAHDKWRAFQDKNQKKKKKKPTRQNGDSARPKGVFKLGVAWNAYKSDEWKPWTIHTGDRMVNTKNWYKEDCKDAFMNGQLSTVVHAEQQQIILRCDEDTYWICDRKRIRDQIVPCHVITMHKSQGSEYDSVLIWMSYASPHRTRNMLYTAITRAKSTCVLYSSKTILQKIVDTEEPERFTLMSDRTLKQIRACRHPSTTHTNRPTRSTLKPRPKRPLPTACSDPEQEGDSKAHKIRALDRFQFQSSSAMK